MKTFAVIVGVIILSAAAILCVCIRAVNKISREEEKQIQRQIEYDLFL